MDYIIIILFILLALVVSKKSLEIKDLQKEVEEIQEERKDEEEKRIRILAGKAGHEYRIIYYKENGIKTYRIRRKKGDLHEMFICYDINILEKHILSLTNQGHTKKHSNKETPKGGFKQTTSDSKN